MGRTVTAVCFPGCCGRCLREYRVMSSFGLLLLSVRLCLPVFSRPRDNVFVFKKQAGKQSSSRSSRL